MPFNFFVEVSGVFGLMNFLLARPTIGSESGGRTSVLPVTGIDVAAKDLATEDPVEHATTSRAVAADTSCEASPVVVALLHFDEDDLNERSLFFSVVVVPPL